MFQGLPQGSAPIAQGATLFILNRKEFSVETASVTNVSQPHVSKAAQSNPALAMQGFVVDISLAIGGENTSIEYPVNAVSANYPEKGWFVSPDRSAVTREIEAMENNSKQALSQNAWHERVVKEAPALVLQLNPERQMELQQSQKIAQLESQIAALSAVVNEKLDRVVEAFSAVVPKKPKKEETL